MKIASNIPNLSFRAKRGISRPTTERLEKQILRFAQDDNLGHFRALVCRRPACMGRETYHGE